MSGGGDAVLASATAAVLPLSLETVTGVAELQTRTDRKYLIAPELFLAMTRTLGPGLAVLEVDGARAFRYESVYFDTPTLDSFHGAAHGRRRRFKVRTRTYLDSGVCVLEVKTRSGRDETVKHRIPYHPDDRHRLTVEGLGFVAEHVRVPVGTTLAPVLTTSYRRATLVVLTDGTRLTCDAALVCTSVDGASVALRDRLLVETKSWGAPTTADRFLWSAGHRPVAISKFCLGMAALDPRLPANRWNRTLRHHFGWTPERTTGERLREPALLSP